MAKFRLTCYKESVALSRSISARGEKHTGNNVALVLILIFISCTGVKMSISPGCLRTEPVWNLAKNAGVSNDLYNMRCHFFFPQQRERLDYHQG